MKSIIIAFAALLLSISGFSQEKYWITFTDKDTINYNYKEHLTVQAIENRLAKDIDLFQPTDIPVKEAYMDSLQIKGIQVENVSSWMNSVSAYLEEEDISRLKGSSYIEDIAPVNTDIVIASVDLDMRPEDYGLSVGQMEGDVFAKEGISGKGVKVGIIDAGFYTANLEPMLSHLFEEGKIKAQKDFIDPSRTDIITDKATNADYHGKKVLDKIAGINQGTGVAEGLAYNADFYLARTENGNREHRGEEDDWIEALEWMDKQGVQLINTSLGYAINMDDPKDNYTQEEMDGKTARITKAAQIATDEKGIFLVVSAGNEGANPKWRIVSAPADAKGVLSVGATDGYSTQKIGYSSIGPESLSYLKPNVSCFSPNGTSFSAPAVTGFVACLMEYAPDLSNQELKEIVEKSGHLYPYGNNFIGYGVPKASRALKLIDEGKAESRVTKVKAKGKKTDIEFENKTDGEAVVFLKSDERNVVSQTLVAVEKGKLSIKRNEGGANFKDVKFSTVSFNDEVYEVEWPGEKKKFFLFRLFSKDKNE